MWCEDGWCGHYRLESELYYIGKIQSHPDKLSPQEVRERSQQEIPLFWTFWEYMDSDFFRENTDLWIPDLENNRENMSLNVWKLQRMLLILWYMREDDFFASNLELQWPDSDAYRDDPNGGVYREWYFWLKTQTAVELFQENNMLRVDGRVWNDTKLALYRELYISYHILALASIHDRKNYVFNLE